MSKGDRHLTDETSANLLREWLTAKKVADEYTERFFIVEAVQPGQPIRGGEPLTVEAIEEIERLRLIEQQAHDRYLAAFRS
jgi:hypothetical protein